MGNFAPKSVKQLLISQFLPGFIFLWTSLLINAVQLLLIPLRWIGYVDLQRTINGKLTYLHWILVPAYAQWWADISVNLYVRTRDLKYLGKEKAVVILNHKSQLDWITLWTVGNSFGVMENIKALAKQSLLFAPVIGPAFWLNEYILLKRNFSSDKDTLSNSVKNYSAFQYNFWLILFCEGTRFTPEKHKLSTEFARQKGLKPLKHHLMPRTKGFVSVVSGLRKAVPAIYDMSVCFGGNKNPTLSDLLKGISIRADVYLRRIPMEEVPEDSEKCSEFVHTTYQEKDDLCEYYAQNDKFPTTDKSGSDEVLVKQITRTSRALFFMIVWTAVFAAPGLYLTLKIVFGGSVIMYVVTLTTIALFFLLYWLMIGLGTAQSTYSFMNVVSLDEQTLKRNVPLMFASKVLGTISALPTLLL
uniref:1-acyl-sn-glycerol-3-phosphate acyltransferase delta-like n=1 Tax=Phallusia mammillata TaxID=59560 RepID=A0A6F9D689_9ASCI|nr:1-acyl-sn-glycerol-3-phosphate acyltransferase delta-like [Phallusia mammillata]